MSSRLRILVCTVEAPFPPFTGTRHPLYEVTRRLAGRHDVSMLAYEWPEQDAIELPGVAIETLPGPASTSRARRLGTWARASRADLPLRMYEFREPMGAALRRRLADGFDVVHVTNAALGTVGPALAGVPNAMVALDAWYLNAEAQAASAPPWLRRIRRIERDRIARFEGSAFADFDRVVLVSQEDADALRRLNPALETRVIPNGVDAQAFAPGDEPEEPGLITFVGTMRWDPNIHAARTLCRDVLPLVRRRHPEARVAIVGRSVGEAVRREFEGYEGVDVVGEVPAVQPWLRRAQVFACPMVSGTGIKNKLLEALACGTASVATPLACRGTTVVDGEHVLLGDDPAALAGHVVRLLEDRELRERLGAAGRAYVCDHHDWDAVTGKYEALYRDAIAARADRTAA